MSSVTEPSVTETITQPNRRQQRPRPDRPGGRPGAATSLDRAGSPDQLTANSCEV